MSNVLEILKDVSKLDLVDKTELVSYLLEDLDPNPHYVSDKEVKQRLDELRSGAVRGLSEDEFWNACGRP